jgi:protease IV
VAESSPIRRFLSALGRAFDWTRRLFANLLFLLVLLVIALALFGGPGRAKVPKGGALLIDPEGEVVEQATQLAPLSQWLNESEVDAETPFRDLYDALKNAKTDSRIKLVVLSLDNLDGISPGHLEELGNAIAAVKAAGKEVIAAGDSFSQAQYYLASFASTVYMHPMGEIGLEGYAAYQVYFKDLLDKLKVNVHVFRVGTYKEAVEPFMRNNMSKEAREANQALVDELWSRYLTVVAANRKLAPDQLGHYVDDYSSLLQAANGDTGRLALEHGLVDELLSRDEIRDRLIAKVGEDSGDFRYIDHRDYMASLRQREQQTTANDVAVLVAAGVIEMGEAPRGRIGADTISELIRKARTDDGVKAMVLRVDSPGGSAFASEIVRQELEQFQSSGKPLVVSMAGTAASGGYWISATADEIWAEPTTITGSIGIFGILPTFEGSIAAIGVGRDGVGSTSLAGASDPLGALSEPMGKIIQANVDNGYRRFIDLVARGRDMTPDDVDHVGQGRVWSGDKALELKLIDGVGGLDEAIAAAAKRANIQRYGVRYLEKPLSTRDQLLAQIFQNLGLADDRAQGISMLARRISAALSQLPAFDDPGHIYGICESCAVTLR